MQLHYKKKYIYLIMSSIVLGLIIYFLLLSQKKDAVIINNHEIIVDVVSTPEEREFGLSGRRSLCETCGMFFVFDDQDKHTFWMKDMNFDIDIIWIRDGKVVDIRKEVSHKTPEKLLKPKEKADHVLEVLAGYVKINNIEVGQEVEF